MLNKQRQDNRIIVDFVITLIFLFSLTGILVIPVFSSMGNISEKKDQFNKIYNTYSDLLVKGLPYTTNPMDIKDKKGFKQLLGSDSNLNPYTKKLLSFNKLQNTGISKKDYDDFLLDFSNGTIKTFDEFVKTKTQELYGVEKQEDVSNLEAIIGAILPKYDDSLNISNDIVNNSLTNIDFVNNIENLLIKHGLTTNSKIGISQIVKVDQTIKSKKNNKNKKVNNNGFEAGLYYIPLKLDLEGEKKDFLNFFKEIELYGNLYMFEVVNKDTNKVEKELRFKDKNGNFRNVLEKKGNSNLLLKDMSLYNQLIKIEGVQMSEYIDDTTISNNDTLLEAINGKQIDDNYHLIISLQFYISGVSDIELSVSLKKIIGELGDIELINSIDKLIIKSDKEELKGREKMIVDYYNTTIYNDDDLEMLGLYNKLKIRVKKYLDILNAEGAEEKYGKVFIDNTIIDLKKIEKKLFEEYFQKDIGVVLKDLKTISNIKSNYKKIEEYVYKFSLIKKELDIIHNNL